MRRLDDPLKKVTLNTKLGSSPLDARHGRADCICTRVTQLNARLAQSDRASDSYLPWRDDI